MVNGISKNAGKMAREVAEYVYASKQLYLNPISLTGPGCGGNLDFHGDNLLLVEPKQRQELLDAFMPDIVVDFTEPSIIERNVQFYCDNNLPMVVGTTGGNRDNLVKMVDNSGGLAVIAPNMAPQIVALQKLISVFSKDYADQWVRDENSGIYVLESHQGIHMDNLFQGKKDTSGTAKAIVGNFQDMGLYESQDQSQNEFRVINKVRTEEEQVAMGIPREHLKGHGWHKYQVHAFPESDNVEIVEDLGLRLHDFMQNNSVFKGVCRRLEAKPYVQDSHFTGNQDRGTCRVSAGGNILFRVESQAGMTTFDHRVNGRGIYARGTLDALDFIAEKMKQGTKGVTYSMMDVLDS